MINDELREESRSTTSRRLITSSYSSGAMQAFGLDPSAETPAAGSSVTSATRSSPQWRWLSKEGTPESAQLVAAECITLAETKDHLNWELIGETSTRCPRRGWRALREAHKEVEEQEDEHLYHSTRLGPRAVDRRTRDALSPSAARGAEGCEDGDRCGAGRAGSFRDDLMSQSATALSPAEVGRRVFLTGREMAGNSIEQLHPAISLLCLADPWNG